nr:hypothetical protein CparaKRNrm2_p115 [Cryptomonas paramecium]
MNEPFFLFRFYMFFINLICLKIKQTKLKKEYVKIYTVWSKEKYQKFLSCFTPDKVGKIYFNKMFRQKICILKLVKIVYSII